jgi:hypothetical protein
MKITIFFFGLLLLSLMSVSCCCCKKNIPKPTPTIPHTVIQKGDRQLSIDVSMPSDNDYNKAFELAEEIGMERIGLFQNWDTIEPSPRNYSGTWLSIADKYYPAKKVSLDLTIAVIHTNHSTVPEDIRNKALNDPEVIERFKSLLDFVFSQMPNTHFSSIVISSESDIYLGTDEKKWEQFESFYKEIVSYIHVKKPGISVTTEFAFNGLTGQMKKKAQDVNKLSDVIGVSYYPISDDFNVKDPAIVSDDFNTIVAIYPHKPIIFYQFGYPSSEYIKSSEERQALFISEAFRAWDKHKDKIKMIDFTWLHDFFPQKVDEMTGVYGISSRGFTEFIGTLGLRTYEDLDKPAFQRLKEETHVRGW